MSEDVFAQKPIARPGKRPERPPIKPVNNTLNRRPSPPASAGQSEPGSSPMQPEAISSPMLEQGEEIVYIEIDLLEKNPYQPRRRMDEAELLGLMFTIKKNGFTDVLPARTQGNTMQLAAGHRRTAAVRRLLLKDTTTGSDVAPLAELRASLAALLQEDPKIEGLKGNCLPLVIREYSDRQMMDIAWGENARRSPLLPPEEGDLFLTRRAADRLTQTQLAEELGVEVTYIKRREAAARDPEDIKGVWDEKPDSMRAVTYLRQLETAEQRDPLIAAYKAGELTTDQLRDAVVFVKNPNQGAREHLDEDGASAHPGQNGASKIVSAVALPVAEEREDSPIAPASTRAQVQAEPVATAGTRVAALPRTAAVLVAETGSVNQVAAEEDRALRVRVTILQTSLRGLMRYHRELLESGVTASPEELKVRFSIDRILEDIKRAHGHE